MLDDLIAICGENCARCRAYTASRSGKHSDLEQAAAESMEWAGHQLSPEEVPCDGCRVPDGRLASYCFTCEIRACALDKGHATCAHCPDCPCDKIGSPQAREALAALKASLR